MKVDRQKIKREVQKMFNSMSHDDFLKMLDDVGFDYVEGVEHGGVYYVDKNNQGVILKSNEIENNKSKFTLSGVYCNEYDDHFINNSFSDYESDYNLFYEWPNELTA